MRRRATCHLVKRAAVVTVVIFLWHCGWINQSSKTVPTQPPKNKESLLLCCISSVCVCRWVLFPQVISRASGINGVHHHLRVIWSKPGWLRKIKSAARRGYNGFVPRIDGHLISKSKRWRDPNSSGFLLEEAPEVDVKWLMNPISLLFAWPTLYCHPPPTHTHCVLKTLGIIQTYLYTHRLVGILQSWFYYRGARNTIISAAPFDLNLGHIPNGARASESLCTVHKWQINRRRIKHEGKDQRDTLTLYISPAPIKV